ncbi:MAG TPA: hypothetical protein VF739_12350 [Ktedonobacterales bacterium]
MSQVDTPCDPTLEREGWTRRFTAIGARLQEAIDLYRALGFEIRLEPAEPRADELADQAACAQCFVMSLARTVYTRPSQRRAGASDPER